IVSSTPIADLFTSYRIESTGDFNGDGKDDVLLRSINSSDAGRVYYWQMNGTQITATVTVADLVNQYQRDGTGDFNGHHKHDIVIRGDDATVYEWQMNGTALANYKVADLFNQYQIQGTGDFNGDGKDDLLIRSTSGSDVGNVYDWQMNGAAHASYLVSDLFA